MIIYPIFTIIPLKDVIIFEDDIFLVTLYVKSIKVQIRLDIFYIK